MVINIGALKSGDYDTVYDDIRYVTEAAHEGGALLKVIIETALLSDEEKVIACELARKARADFVKTSTDNTSGVNFRAISPGDWGIVELDDMSVYFQFVQQGSRVPRRTVTGPRCAWNP